MLFENLFETLLVHHRWIIVVFILLPLSTLYDVFYNIRCQLMFKFFSAPQLHEKRVKDVQKQVRRWNELGSKVPMCTARPGWQTMSPRQPTYKNSLYGIDVNLIDVLNIDERRKIVRVEPLVTMGQITGVLNPLGWTLPIVPELDDLTVGGLIMGCGVETSSHKYGLFQHICEAFELVLADGTLIRCTKDEHADLFYSVPWSHGTLGFLVAADIRIIPAKRYVRLDYLPVYSQEEMLETYLREVNNTDNDFVEGLVYTKDLAVIMIGQMTDKVRMSKINEIGKWHKPWFYLHVKTFLKNGSDFEFIPLRDYYHRHTRSFFWEIEDIIPFGNNYFFRWLCGWMVPPKISFLKLTQTELITKFIEKYQVVQDILIPTKHLKDALNFLDRKLQVYPLWLCAFWLPNNPGMVHPPRSRESGEMYLDIGIYGKPPKEVKYKQVESMREVEAYVRNINGFQMLYSDCFQTKEEFHQMFDHSLYNEMRTALKCSKAFPQIYDKIAKPNIQ